MIRLQIMSDKSAPSLKQVALENYIIKFSLKDIYPEDRKNYCVIL